MTIGLVILYAAGSRTHTGQKTRVDIIGFDRGTKIPAKHDKQAEYMEFPSKNRIFLETTGGLRAKAMTRPGTCTKV